MSQEKAKLLSAFELRGVRLPNRLAMSPMCMYSAVDGLANDWHLAHFLSRAMGGTGLIMTEATAVTATGRITPGDLGLWTDEQIAPLQRIVSAIKSVSSVAGVQLAHAGRKGGRSIPWEGNSPIPSQDWGARLVAPSPVPYREDWETPEQLDLAGIKQIIAEFASATRRAVQAGFEVIEGHFAHGYLLHQFFSPLSNFRTDSYGGSFENRARLLVEVASAMRQNMPDELVLAIRISAVDWVEGGITLADSVRLSHELKAVGVDLVDCSSGAVVPEEVIEAFPNYQLGFASAIKQQTGLATAAVGLIREAQQANQIIEDGSADLVFLGRALLKDPYWARKAAEELGLAEASDLPIQYRRAVSRMIQNSHF